ncbi:hypothetical protein [Balneola vulgaris]|jgi:E3 ubiquitin-protein ligase DOA10|uniref:hypothetical protein n=1 Tax=Balneola vulgaris TaxID=287535 RepID=UPI000367082D|nr:hypothetical protein [Balneola vulgaris]
MGEEEFIIALVGIVFGTGFTMFLFWNIFSIVKTWLNRKSGTSQGEINPQFFKALGDFKKSTERRIANLESIVAELEEEKIRIHENPNATGEIEIEEPEIRTSSKDDNNNNLRNMLNE